MRSQDAIGPLAFFKHYDCSSQFLYEARRVLEVVVAKTVCNCECVLRKPQEEVWLAMEVSEDASLGHVIIVINRVAHGDTSLRAAALPPEMASKGGILTGLLGANRTPKRRHGHIVVAGDCGVRIPWQKPPS
jgi:hypothetical protein